MATEFTKAMEGSLSHEFETGLPAADVWEVYGSLLVVDLIPQLLPQVFSKVELVEGDGGVGSVLLVTFPPGTPGSETFKEKFIKVDNENYIKEVLVTEGSFLDHGFKKYLVRIEISGKEQKTSTIRSTIEYEVDREHASNPPVVSTSGLATIAKAITEYIKEKKGPKHFKLSIAYKISYSSCLQLTVPQKRSLCADSSHWGYLSMSTELKAMKGSICHEFDTGLPAADVWEVYGSLLFGKLMPQLLPEVASKVELVEGDGGSGSVLLITFPPGTPGSETFKEKFIKVDNENYIKETIVTEGGLLDHGFQKYMVRIEIVGKEEKTSIIRTTIEYEVDHEHADTPPVFSTDGLATIAEAITKYIKEQKGSDLTKIPSN